MEKTICDHLAVSVSSVFSGLFGKGRELTRGIFKTGLVVLAVSVLAEVSLSQCTPPERRAKLIVQDNGLGRDTLWFGFDATAEYGLDGDLCEFENPPPPPAEVFDARFVNISGHSGQDIPQGMGQGFVQDYRAYVGPAKVDTHRLKFQTLQYPIILRWSIPQILSMSDSALLRDEFAGTLVWVRMHILDSVRITNPGITSLLLIRFGQRTITGVRDYEFPGMFVLEQNYPNPFNPETKIVFDLPSREFVTLKVFNSLGQEVATLVDEELASGGYSARLDAGKYNLASGVYFCRLTAGGFLQTNKMILQK